MKTVTGYCNGTPVGSYSLAGWGGSLPLSLFVGGSSGQGIGVSTGTATASNFYAGPYLTVSIPQVVTQPVGATNLAGATATLSVKVEGSGLEYQWFKNNAKVTASSRISGVKSATLTISNSAVSDSGTYYVVASNPFGPAISSNAVLAVETPVVITLKASPSDAGIVSGGGDFFPGAGVSVTATVTNDCYYFTNWTAAGKTVTNNPYAFTASKSETLTANFAQYAYVIETASAPTNGGTTKGGGTKGCGDPVTLKATANSGFKFVKWVNRYGNVTVATNTTYTFDVSGDAGYLADFADVQPPTLTVTSPSKPVEPVATAAFTIAGTATDNVAVWYVAYSLNSSNEWVHLSVGSKGLWSANVSLEPGKTNTLWVYALDTSGNASKTNKFTIDCTAAGYAPASLSGWAAAVTFQQPSNMAPYELSFRPATIARSTMTTNATAGVGFYTYTLTDPNTAQLVAFNQFGVNTDILSFSDAYTATFIKNGEDTGTMAFMSVSNLVPATISGTVVTVTSAITADSVATNVFLDGAFTSTNSQGSYGGTYTFTQYSPVAAVVQQIFTNPPAASGSSNFILLTYASDSPASGYYDYVGYNALETNFDVGAFSVVEKTNKIKYLAPASLIGTNWTVVPQGQASFNSSFGDATFAEIGEKSSDTNNYGVGAYTYTRTGSNTAELDVSYFPPFNQDQGSNTTLLTFASATHATFKSGTHTGTVTSSAVSDTVPATIEGHTVIATLTFSSITNKASGEDTIVFSYGTFTETSSSKTNKDNGSYTYMPASPNTALVQLALTNVTKYVELTFSTDTKGSFISTHVENSQITEIASGTFTLK